MEIFNHLEALIAGGMALLSTAGVTLWRIEKLRRAFQDGVVRPVAREEAVKAVDQHEQEAHAHR